MGKIGAERTFCHTVVLGTTCLREVFDNTTAVGLSVRLEELYMAKNLANKIRLKEMLYTFRMAEGTPV